MSEITNWLAGVVPVQYGKLKIWRQISSLMILSVLLLCGCSSERSILETVLPVEHTIIYNNTFRITCLSWQYEYNSKQMQKDAPFHFELQIEYIGEDSCVTIWHGVPIGGIQMLDQNHEYILPQVIGDSLCHTEMKKGEIYTVHTWTGKSEYEFLGGFPCGNYIAEAYIEFSFFENDAEEDVRCYLDLPFKIV